MKTIYRSNKSIPTNTDIKKVFGVIRGLWLGQYEDGPASFKMETDKGELLGFQCYLEPKEAAKEYTLGRICFVKYYIHEREVQMQQEDGSHIIKNMTFETPIKIALGDISNKRVKAINPCYFSYSAGRST
jgi:hypothetical protein